MPGPTLISVIGTPTNSETILQVLARGRGQVGLLAAFGDVLGPAAQLLVLADGVMEHRLVVREVLELGALGAAVAGAHASAGRSR